MRITILTKAQRFWIYLTTFLIILDNGTIYTHIKGLSIIDPITKYAPILTLFIVLIISKKRIISNNVFLGRLIILNIWLITMFILSGAYWRSSILFLFYLDLLLLYIYAIEYKRKPFILIAYRDIMLFFGAASLIFWVGGSLLKIIPNVGFVLSSWGEGPRGFPYVAYNYFLYFEHDAEVYLLDHQVIPNNSIFVEKAFSAYSYAIALIYELFLEEKTSIKRVFVFFLALVTTLSTSGIITAMIVMFLYLNSHHGKSPLIKLAYFLIIPTILVYIYSGINMLLESKASRGHSFVSRAGDFENGIDAWLNSPLYGYGFGNEAIIASFDTGQSNSISQILMSGGIMFAILYLCSFGKFFLQSVKKRDMNLLYFLVSFLVFFIFTAIATRNFIVYIVVMLFLWSKPLVSQKKNYD